MSYILKRKIRKYRKKFVMPVLTSNGTMGGDSFAVDCSTPKTAEYEMFNTGSAGTKGVDTNPNAAPQWVSFYNPVPLKVTKLRIGQIKDTTQAQYYYITAYKIQVSDDNQTWTDVYSGTGSKPATTLTANIADSGYHKYYRVYVTSAAYYSGYPRVFFFGIDFDAEAEDAVFYDDIMKSYVVKRKKLSIPQGTFKPNYTVVGSPTVNNGVVSGFSSANYLTLSNSMNVSDGSPWEMMFKITTGSSFGTHEVILTKPENTAYMSRFSLNAGKLRFVLSNNNTNYFVEILGATTLNLNTEYYTKAEFTGSAYNIYLSENGIDWQLEANKISSTIYTLSTFSRIGYGYDTGGNTSQPFLGSIDLKESYIKIGSEIWWNCKYNEDVYDSISYAVKRKIRKYYKYVSQPWEQPTLTANGTIGGNSFAVAASNESHGAAYNAINDNTNSWVGSGGYPYYYTFYNPSLLHITKMDIGAYGDLMAFNAFELQVSEDNTTWTTIYSGNSGFVNGGYQTFILDLSNVENNISKYWRFKFLTPAISTSRMAGITRLKITANAYSAVQEVSSTDDWDFYEDIEY